MAQAIITRRGGAKEEFELYVFTSSTVWTIPSYAKRIDVSCIGGGGKGGVYSYTSSTNTAAGGGGGGSGYIENFYDVPFTPNESISITVGTAGGYSQYKNSTYQALSGTSGSNGTSSPVGNNMGGNGGNGSAGGGGGGSVSGIGGSGGDGYNTVGGLGITNLGGGGGSYLGSDGSSGSGSIGGAAGIPPSINDWYIFSDPSMSVVLLPIGGKGAGYYKRDVNYNNAGGQTISEVYSHNNRVLKLNGSVIACGYGGGGNTRNAPGSDAGVGCVAVKVYY